MAHNNSQKPRRWYDNVQALRKRLGLRYDDLMHVLGVTTPGAVGHYLTGRREPSIKQLKRLASFFNMTVSELIQDDAYFVQREDEKELIDLLRSLPADQRDAAIALLRSMASNPSKPAPVND